MSYVTSGGETRTELARVLRFPADNQSLIKQLQDLQAQFALADRHPGIELHLANGAWMDQTYAIFRDTYKKLLGRAFEAQLHSVKFRDRQGVSDQINAWIARETKGRIPSVVGPEDIESRSGLNRIDEPGLVTVNAVYFKAGITHLRVGIAKGASSSSPSRIRGPDPRPLAANCGQARGLGSNGGEGPGGVALQAIAGRLNPLARPGVWPRVAAWFLWNRANSSASSRSSN